MQHDLIAQLRSRGDDLSLRAADALAGFVGHLPVARCGASVLDFGTRSRLPPFLLTLFRSVSEKGRKRLRHVHTLHAETRSGDLVLSLQGGQPLSAADHGTLTAAAREWIATFETASGCRVVELLGGSPWRSMAIPADADAAVMPVHDLRAFAGAVAADWMAEDWTDDTPREIRFHFQVLARSAVGSRFPSDTWLTKGGLFWRTPRSRACVDEMTEGLRGWLSGPGQSLFQGIGNATLVCEPERTAQRAVA